MSSRVYNFPYMRRREKFVLSSIFLSLCLLLVQYVNLEWRYLAVAAFSLLTYLVSIWSLRDDLQRFELLTIVPLPACYSAAVGVFYFLFPENTLFQVLNLALFGVGMYATYLTANIYSVAKGRTIQLIHAAHAVGLFFTMFMSLMFLNTIFSHKLDFYWNALLVGLVHFPLIFLFLWSVRLEQRIEREVVELSALLTLLIMESVTVISFFPFSVWSASLLVMTLLYMGLGVLQNHLKSRLFQNTIQEYSAVAVVTGVAFFLLLPWK